MEIEVEPEIHDILPLVTFVLICENFVLKFLLFSQIFFINIQFCF